MTRRIGEFEIDRTARKIAKYIKAYWDEQGYTVKQQLQMHKQARKWVAQAKKGRKA